MCLLTIPFYLFSQIFYTPPPLVPYITDAPVITSRAAVLIDTHTGALLYSKNPNEEIPPASLAKLMTMHIAMQAVKEGRASYDDLVTITVDSWAQSQPPRSSLMFLEPGQRVTLREIMLGLAISSGNDAAVAAALHFAPNMNSFAGLMNTEARRMGLRVTRFTESSGICELNKTTAAEFALFSRHYIRLHPDSLSDFHTVPSFSYPLAENVTARNRNRFRTFTQNNPNTLIRTFPGVDGLKTGYITESGHSIALTAERNDTRFVLVVLGAPAIRGGSWIRNEDSARLLNWAFNNFKTVRPVIGQVLNARLWKGKGSKVELMLTQSADFTSPADRADFLYYDIVLLQPLIAPLPAGYNAGYLSIRDEQGELSRTPLVTKTAYESGSLLKRIWHSFLLLFSRR